MSEAVDVGFQEDQRTWCVVEDYFNRDVVCFYRNYFCPYFFVGKSLPQFHVFGKFHQ